MDTDALPPSVPRAWGASEPAAPGAAAPPEKRSLTSRRPPRRGPLRRLLGRGSSWAHRLLFETPPGRWLHRRLEQDRHLPVVDVPLGRSAAALEGLTIAFLSDVHAGTFLFADELARIAERVMEARPDLIVLGGDLIDTDLREIELFEGALARLSAPLGIYAVPGNHDYFVPSDIGAWADYLTGHGVEVLTNRGRRCVAGGSTAGFWIAGVDDMTEGRPDLARALAGRRAGEPTLLLSHHPDLFPEAARLGIDLQLSGHTHGGQVRLLGWAPLRHSDHGYLAGLYRRGSSRLWVGSGAGITMLPIRIGTRAEVAILRLRCQ